MQAALIVSIMLNTVALGTLVIVRSSTINQRLLSKWLWWNAAKMDQLREAKIAAERTMHERYSERSLVIHD